MRAIPGPDGRLTARVVVASSTPLFRLGVQTAFDGCPDMTVVGAAESADEAITMVDALRPEVVLIDVALSDRDGVDTAAALRRDHPDCGIVLLGPPGDDLLFRALHAQVSAFVPSASRPEAILAAVRGAALAPRSFSAPDLAQALIRRDRLRAHLSPREVEVVRHMRDGLTTTGIAHAMTVSESTVKTYVARVYDKLGVSSRAEAVAASQMS